MRVFRSALVLCLALAAATLFGVGAPLESLRPARLPPEHSPQAGVLAGHVTDAGGAPMAGVTVELLLAGVVVQTAKTDALGEFRFAAIDAGIYEVRATREDLVPASVRTVVNELPAPPLRLSLGIPQTPGSDQRGLTHQADARGLAGAIPGGTIGGVVGGIPGAPPPPPPAPIAQMESARVPGAGAWPAPRHPAYEPHQTAAYDRIDDNRFRRAADSPVSTFSIDVDTASYANVRRFLNAGTLLPADAVRIEELINYFRFAYAPGHGDAPFSVTSEVAPCPWNPGHRLALIGLQARREEAAQAQPRNLVFLLDVSGSMMPADRLPLVKTAMRMLVDTLTHRDRVAIVVYAGASGLVLPSTPGDRRDDIHRAIANLHAGGSTNGAAGIQLAYDTAAAAFVRGGVNRVILATDGDFNVGVTSQGELIRLIEQQRERGIFLSVLGVGTDNLKDSTMEKLADRGNGNYAYLDSLHEARRVLIEEAASTLVTVAKDVKIQVEFNPRTVGAYRLVGYENRLLNREDFNDDRKDAGDIGAGHTVTALYELIPPGAPIPAAAVDPLVYQEPLRASAASSRPDELMTVKLRYKLPDDDRSQLLTIPVRQGGNELTANVGFAAAVAQFGMLLRNSELKGESSWSSARALARTHRGDDPSGYRAEFIRLVDLAAALEAQHARSPQASAGGHW